MSTQGRNIQIVGGEPFYPPKLLFSTKKNDIKQYFKSKFADKNVTYTYGGYYSIKKIIRDIEFEEKEHVLLPSYMCPTILKPFQECHIRYYFFKIHKNLSIDTEDLLSKINNNTKAVFFIHYFGFNVSKKEKIVLQGLRDKGIILIQDLVQDFFVSPHFIIGDFAFNSFRKFFPVEGSCIMSNKELEIIDTSFNTRYFFNKLSGRYYRYKHYKKGISESVFLDRFSRAEKYYYKKGICGFNRFDEFLINRFEINKLSAIRKNNYSMLLEEFSSIAIIKEIKDCVPLAFPIVVENRDIIIKKMKEHNVFCPIHWRLSDEIDKNEYSDSWWLSDHILSIPIDAEINYMPVVNYLKSIL